MKSTWSRLPCWGRSIGQLLLPTLISAAAVPQEPTVLDPVQHFRAAAAELRFISLSSVLWGRAPGHDVEPATAAVHRQRMAAIKSRKIPGIAMGLPPIDRELAMVYVSEVNHGGRIRDVLRSSYPDIEVDAIYACRRLGPDRLLKLLRNELARDNSSFHCLRAWLSTVHEHCFLSTRWTW